MMIETLETQRKRADRLCSEMQEALSLTYPDAEIDRFGPMELDWGWGIWIRTRTDDDRERLNSDDGMLGQLHAIGSRDNQFNGITVQSQETVDRSYEGSWYLAMR